MKDSVTYYVSGCNIFFGRRGDNEKFSGRQVEKAWAKDKETLDSENNKAVRPCLSN